MSSDLWNNGVGMPADDSSNDGLVIVDDATSQQVQGKNYKKTTFVIMIDICLYSNNAVQWTS